MSKKKDLKLATEAAERILETKRKIKELQEQVKKDLDLVRRHSAETGHRRYGNTEIYDRLKPAKLVLPVGMKDKVLQDELRKSDLWKYIEQKVDKKLIIENCHEDPQLKEFLEVREIEIVQDRELHIKHF